MINNQGNGNELKHKDQKNMKAKYLIIAFSALLMSTMVSAQVVLDDSGPQVTEKEFPAAEKGQKQVVIKLPAKGNLKDEMNYKVELIAGKKMMVDCNKHGLNGSVEEKFLEGYGYKYYVFTTTGETWSTRMGCPDNSKHEEFVSATPLMIDYYSRVPLVVYVPEDCDVKYRVWSAGRVMEPGECMEPGENACANCPKVNCPKQNCVKRECPKNVKENQALQPKIKDCPEAWIENRMPRVIDRNSKREPTPSSYYIYKGERREISEFDAEWVKKNCHDLEVQRVY